MLTGNPEPPNPAVDLPPRGRYGFVGRETELEALETALGEASIVLVTGPAGVGKTEFACELGRRMGEKGERPGGVLFTSFHYDKYGGGLARVLHEIGTTLQGISFARRSLADQRRWAVDYLDQVPALLIWDDFGAAFDYLDPADVGAMVDFLRESSAGAARFLITGPDDEWPKSAALSYSTHDLGGLNEADSLALAGSTLQLAGVDPGDLDAGYRELLRSLQGNPVAMGAVLPHLDSHAPGELADVLERYGRPGSGILDAALKASFSLLSDRTRAHLPTLALFRQRVLLDVLTFMTQGEVYASVMGEQMGWGACRTFLREARDHGILDSVSPSVYLIPPRVAPFLNRTLEDRLAPQDMATLDREFTRLYAGLGDYFLENLSSESADSTVTGVLAEEANLLRALELADTGAGWDDVQMVLQPLAQVYKMQERVHELRRLRGRLLARIGVEPAEAESKGAGELWMYLRGTEVHDSIARGELDEAEAICHQVLAHLESSGGPDGRPRSASIYHQLGLIAQGRDRHDEADDWYRRSLEINETLGNEADCADSYHQLGRIAQARRRFDDAKGWHRRALAVRQRLGDEAESAGECHRIALASEALGETEGALEWYHRARAGYEQAGDTAGGAAVYHRLGLASQARLDYEDARGWYQRALLAYEEIEDDTAGADDHYQLGVIALQTQQYEDAGESFRLALEGFRRREDGKAMADSYHQLGLVAHSRRRAREAAEWYQKALDAFVELGEEAASAGTWGQLGLLSEQISDYPRAVWYVAHAYEIASAHGLPLLDRARTHLSGLRERMGTEAFLLSWQSVSDTDILPHLEAGAEG